MDLTGSSISWTLRSKAAATTTTRPATSNGWEKIGTRFPFALAGFSPDEIAIAAEQNVVTVEGRKIEKQQREFLHHGISFRPFKRQFNLADYVQVKGASFENGLLQIDLVRELPEAMKPRRISLSASPAQKVQQLDAKAA